jgi:ABC-2 type transport system ATP-binding protein
MEKALIVDGITKEYPGRVAIQDVSFEVKKGSIHGFLGPNGAGKSTTMNIISGLISANKGRVSLFGQDLFPNNLSTRNLIGLLPENPPLYLDMTVEKYLNFVAKIHQVKNAKEQAMRVIESLSLQSVKGRLIGNLSKGYKQRVGLAGAVVYDAPFVMLDEPTNGLDPEAVVEFRDFIRQLSKEKTILFSSHILSEVEQLCDQITIINKGIVRATGSLKEVYQKFSQGLVVKVGIKKGEALPDLEVLGKHKILKQEDLGVESQFHISFEDELDCRNEISKILVHQGVSLLTLQVEPPELENIFLHVTERIV